MDPAPLRWYWTIYPALTVTLVILVWQTYVTQQVRPHLITTAEWRLPVLWMVVYLGFMGRSVSVNLLRHTRYTRKKAALYYDISVVVNLLWTLFLFRDQRLKFVLSLTTVALLVGFRILPQVQGWYPEGAFLMVLELWGLIAWCINIYLLL